jgi:hypothetical protein
MQSLVVLPLDPNRQCHAKVGLFLVVNGCRYQLAVLIFIDDVHPFRRSNASSLSSMEESPLFIINNCWSKSSFKKYALSVSVLDRTTRYS